ncbi:phage tail protein [Zooshikella sp. RANM57]|uniref:phage tail protein n=1 Tax=Zooshikella sp. RANM57 TaxID=3425863 RepID=UPI003D6F8B25
METLPDIPVSYGSSASTEFRVLEANFGDGYTQRAADGINNIRDTWSVTWENRDTADIFTLVKFLKARGGFQAFYWTPPGEVEPRKWICKAFDGPTPAGPDTYTLEASFKEVFEL